MSKDNLSGDWMNAVAESRLQIVFENRNKDYGAYQLRRSYNKTLIGALLFSSALFTLLLAMPSIIDYFSAQMEEEVVLTKETEIVLSEPPPVDESEPPPPPPPPPPLMETIKFTPPVVVDEPVPEDEAPPVQEEIVAQVATVTQEGSGGDDIIIPTENTGTGVVESKAEEVFVSVEEMPKFPGGEEALMKYLAKNINYPAMEKEAGIQGTVYVYFVIDKDGKVTKAEVKRGVRGGAGLEKEALRVINTMPPWSPGKQNGRPCLVSFTLPVRFVLK
jgi:periplasmic protein TonB